MTRIQYLRALALARAYGHEWGRWLEETDEPASIEDIERLARERHNASLAYASWHQPPDGRCPAGCGIMAPTEASGCLVHTSATGRIAWTIHNADASVDIDVRRPAGGVLMATVWASGNIFVAPGFEFTEDHGVIYHQRHVDALREALVALVPEAVADAALADVRAQALPDDVRA